MQREIDYAGALKRGWWVILLMIGAALAAGAWFTAGVEPVYEASAMLVVAPSEQTTEPDEIVRSLDTLERRTVVATFSRIATTRKARARLEQQLGLEEDALRRVRIHGSVVPNTNIIRISASGPDAELVERAANGAAALAAEEASALYRVYTLHILEAARKPYRPDYPDPQRNLVVAAILGLVVGLAAALALDRFRARSGDSGQI